MGRKRKNPEPLSVAQSNALGRDIKCTRCLTGWVAKSKGRHRCGVCKAEPVKVNQSKRTEKDDEYTNALRKHHGLK